MDLFFLISVFIISTCGLIFEFITSSLASYLLGDTIMQFSTIIGVYLFAMGIGSYLSRFIHKSLIVKFVQVEMLIGLFGGCSAAILFIMFEYVAYFRFLLYTTIFIIGMLVGLEIPLIMRILKTHYDFKDLVSRVFTADYIGALFAAIAFPLILVPYLGLLRTSFLFGLLNVLVGLGTLAVVRPKGMWGYYTSITGVVFSAVLVAGFFFSDKIVSFTEAMSYADPVIYSKQTALQKITLTKSRNSLKLFLNGNLQFSSQDEYRYHESLVHIGAAKTKKLKKVLVLGGGDGLAVRELLKYPSIESIVLVDMDKEMTDLFKTHPRMVALNNGSLNSNMVQVENEDAFVWLRNTEETFDYIVVDFPDPSNFSLGKLYSRRFFKELKKAVGTDGIAIIQSTSPYFARKSFWCIHNTIKSVGFSAKPFHVYIPSFGEWGFVIASQFEFTPPNEFAHSHKFLNPQIMDTLFYFPNDMAWLETEVNRLNNQVLVGYFEKEWSSFMR